MDSVAQLTEKERSELFTETAARRNMTKSVIEKDFWVTWTLSKIFGERELNENLRFKGGTTLSKVYGVIERFSEDIDLILNWNTLTNENPEEDRSNKKQRIFNENIREKGRDYIETKILPVLSSLVDPVCKCKIDPEQRNNIYIRYPQSFSDKYIRSEILLEIGPLASWLPYQTYEIKPYAAEEFLELFKHPKCSVPVIKAERTFWEKATILHHEAHRPKGNHQPPRNSRHYYDLAQLAKSSFKKSALDDLTVLKDVVDFKIKFYPRGWANYDLAKPGTFKLIPEDHVLEDVKKDYKEMKSMIYGKYYDYSEIHAVLQELEDEINSL